MNWTSNFNFTIYAVGDPLFMQRVLNAIAALSNAGVLASLGLLGLLLGILLVAMKGISTGGRQVEIPSLFMSMILYGIMFGGTATVTVQGVGAPEGVYSNASYVVDHVPFGVAAMGWMVSNISYDLSEKLEQAYGLPDDTVGDVMSVGFDRSLDWLAAARYASLPDIDDPLHHVSRFRHNVVSYLRFCTPKALDVNADQINTMRQSPEPFDPTIGLGFNSAWDTFGYIDPTTGLTSEPTCAQGVGLLEAARDGGNGTNFFNDITAAAAVPIGFSGTANASNEALAAWAQISATQDQATKFYANALISSAMNEALAGVPIAGDMQVANALMVDTADAQRATKFAGEESLFRRMMRPMMAFFESLIYIAAPFMALVVGFGGMGVKMVGRYAIATIWVSMWMPTLAAINLYQETMVGEAFQPYLSAPSSSTGAAFHTITSLFGAAHAYSALDDIIATGSLLAASTPAITAFLLFGSAYALNGLWSGMSGGEFVNQKMATPDPVNTPSAISRSSLAESSPGGGLQVPGYASSMPKLEFGSTNSISKSAGLVSAENSMTAYSKSIGMRVGESNVADFQKGGRVSESDGSSASMALGEARQSLQQAGVDTSHVDSNTFGQSLAKASSSSWSAGASLKGVTQGVAAVMTDGASAEAGAAGKAGGLTKMFKGGGGADGDAGFNARASATDTDTKGSSASDQLATKISAAMSSNSSVAAAVQGANSAMAEKFSGEGFKSAESVTNNSDFSKMSRDWSQMSRQFREQDQAASTVGARQSIDPLVAAQKIASHSYSGSGGGSAVAMSKAATALENDFKAHGGSADSLRAAQEVFKGTTSPDQARAAGALLAMYQQSPGSNPSAGESASAPDRKAHLASLLINNGVLGVNTGGAMSAPDPVQGSIGKEAGANAGTAKSAVQEAQPGVDVGKVEGAVGRAAGESPGQFMTDAAQKSGMTGTLGSAESGGGEAASIRSGSGGINTSAVDSKASGVTSDANAAMTHVRNEGAEPIVKGMDAISRDDSNAALTMGGKSDVQSHAVSNEWMSGVSQPGANLREPDKTVSQSMLGQDRNGAPSNAPDNPGFAAAVASAAAGAYTNQSPVSDSNLATAMGAVTIASQGGDLSVAQGEQAAKAIENLSPAQRAAFNDYANTLKKPDGSVGETVNMGNAVLLGGVPSVPTGSAPAPSGVTEQQLQDAPPPPPLSPTEQAQQDMTERSEMTQQVFSHNHR